MGNIDEEVGPGDIMGMFGPGLGLPRLGGPIGGIEKPCEGGGIG